MERTAGPAVALRMPKDDNVIVESTDEQAVADGVLVPVDGEGGVNRVTRAVVDHFTQQMGASPVTGPVTDITPLMDAIRAILKLTPDEYGWRRDVHQNRELWLLPNDIGSLTLMFPDDY